jgi:hypothetical protein
MAVARSECDWAQTSAMMAMIGNAFRGKGSKALKPDDFNPHRQPKKLPSISMRDLKKAFVKD